MRFTARIGICVCLVASVSGCQGVPVSHKGNHRLRPLEDVLKSPAAAHQEGIAAAALLDTSGSMRDRLTDADGISRAKLAIAQRALMDLVRQFQNFAQKNPDRKVLLGIYDFSSRGDEEPCREVVKLGPPDLRSAETAVASLRGSGGTPIGNAMIRAKHDLDATGMSRRHILVITDGENNRGYSPGDVANAISHLSGEERASIYFIAFDVSARHFDSVREAGGLVLSANNERDLRQALDFVLTGKILVEQPVSPGTK